MVLDLKGFLNGAERRLMIDTFLDFSGEEYGGEKIFPQPVHVVGTVFDKAEVTRLVLECTVTVEKPCDRCGRHADRLCGWAGPQEKAAPAGARKMDVMERRGNSLRLHGL